jgi:hypothetical protein
MSNPTCMYNWVHVHSLFILHPLGVCTHYLLFFPWAWAHSLFISHPLGMHALSICRSFSGCKFTHYLVFFIPWAYVHSVFIVLSPGKCALIVYYSYPGHTCTQYLLFFPQVCVYIPIYYFPTCVMNAFNIIDITPHECI